VIGDVVKDWVSGQEYTVTWDGSNRATLLDYDTRYTGSKPDAKDRQTQGATMTLDVRPRSVFFKQEL
jgi:hypothetical protein